MLDTVAQSPDIDALMNDIGRKAKAAARPLGFASTEAKNNALNAMADAILANKDHILAENAKDLKDVAGTDMLASFVDRLTLTEKQPLPLPGTSSLIRTATCWPVEAVANRENAVPVGQ